MMTLLNLKQHKISHLLLGQKKLKFTFLLQHFYALIIDRNITRSTWTNYNIFHQGGTFDQQNQAEQAN